jgi:hypothetical protein
MTRRVAALPPIVLAAAALAPGGCGTTPSNSADHFKGPQHDVAQAIDDLVTAAQRADARKICDQLLTPALRGHLDQLARQTRRGADCADELKKSIQDANAFDVKVLSVQVAGATATARVRTNVPHGADPVDVLTLANQRGWRLSKLP